MRIKDFLFLGSAKIRVPLVIPAGNLNVNLSMRISDTTLRFPSGMTNTVFDSLSMYLYPWSRRMVTCEKNQRFHEECRNMRPACHSRRESGHESDHANLYYVEIPFGKDRHGV